jgi:hypothetical protein
MAIRDSIDRLKDVQATQKTVASVGLDQERWRSGVLETRFASLRTEATALIAVIAVVLGVAAGAVGNLAGREVSSFVKVLIIAGIALSVLALLAGGALAFGSLRVMPHTRYPPAALPTEIGEAEGASLVELGQYSQNLETGIENMVKYLRRARLALGVGVFIGIVIASTLIFVNSQPNQNRLVNGSTVTVRTSP